MRLLRYFLFLSFLLLGSGQHFYANTNSNLLVQTSTQHLKDDQQIKLSCKDQISTLIEDNDSDFEEDYHDGSVEKEKDNTFAIAKTNLTDYWYLLVYNQFTLNDYTKRGTILQLPHSNSTPAYIKNRVLRI